MSQLLSLKECRALKGTAILMIVLHNLLHGVTPFHENEKFFDPHKASYYLEHFLNAPIMSFFGYFGWIGVAVFIFLTGYGLSIKYSGGLQDVDQQTLIFGRFKIENKYLQFIIKHYKKLFILILLPYAIHIDYKSIKDLVCIAPDLLFVRNILSYPNTPFGIISIGTYWYVGMCMELYVFFAFCNKYFHNKFFIGITLLISFLSITFPELPWIRYSKFHFIGWLPVFYLGYFAAKFSVDKISLTKRILLFAIITPLYIFASLNHYTWFLSDVLGTLCFVSIAPFLCNKILMYIGGISACVFACHPLVRDWWYFLGRNYMEKSDLFVIASVISYLAVCIVLSDIYSRYLRKINF